MYWRNGAARNRASTVLARANCCALEPQKKIRPGEEAAPAAVARNAAATATAARTAATMFRAPRELFAGGGAVSRMVRRRARDRRSEEIRSPATLHGTPRRANTVIEKETSTAPAPPARIARATGGNRRKAPCERSGSPASGRSRKTESQANPELTAAPAATRCPKGGPGGDRRRAPRAWLRRRSGTPRRANR